MSSLKNNINLIHSAPNHETRDTIYLNGYHHAYPARARTPLGHSTPVNHNNSAGTIGSELGAEEDPKLLLFKEIYTRNEARLKEVFGGDGAILELNLGSGKLDAGAEPQDDSFHLEEQPQIVEPPRKAARTIDEDDYDESDGEDEEGAGQASPMKSKGAVTTSKAPLAPLTPTVRRVSSSSMPASLKLGSLSAQAKTAEDVRKRLEADRKASEDAAKQSFYTLFHPLENDRDAMLEQKKLDESERQVDVEMNGTGSGGGLASTSGGNTQHGTLSQTNLGASSLTLKHLIARIDAKRDQVQASDAELRSLMSEVRKNRSKWASPEKIGQEELYEAAEKVLSELKAMTEHSTAFLTRVNKREAPDYYNVIKQPMDLGTMTKKLKAVFYKSKDEFVNDLNLIWSNCLKYNANPDHFLRRHALFMRKETEKLVPLIPPITIRDRAAVEVEERRLQNGDVDPEGLEESDDEPIISSRGRTAPGKTSKKGPNARKAPPGLKDGSPAPPDAKLLLNSFATVTPGSNLKHEHLRAESESIIDGNFTPPPGSLTPAGPNGVLSHDSMDIDSLELPNSGIAPPLGGATEDIHDDLEYKAWKQVTKKDRALVTAERHRLFKNDQLNPDEPALLRRRLGMRRWLRKQKEAKEAVSEGASGKPKAETEVIKRDSEVEPTGETLAEGMEGEEERILPDYYDTLSAVPDFPSRVRWVEDSEGQVQDPSDEFLRVLPPGRFVSPESNLTKRISDNMRQMQETRKLCSKIGIVKQMQLQSQMYHGQFQKHEPAHLIEKDIEPLVVSTEGPLIATAVCRAALQRSVGKMFFHAGFEEFQPSALEAATDLAGDFFTKLARTLVEYTQVPKVAVTTIKPGSTGKSEVLWRNRFTTEEILLHTLHENGSDIDALDAYVKDDLERASSKLGIMHERMKAHLADLLRPALTDGGPDGSNAFNDGSEQFVAGDFAEDLDEDFFGFKELGLDKEFGYASLSVPLHLLQNRMHNAHQAQNQKYFALSKPSKPLLITYLLYLTSSLSSSLTYSLSPPPPLPPLTIASLKSQIGLVHNFFLAKLHANGEAPLVEDDDLPQKQRFQKPRLPPTGKITGPRKRPLRELGPGKGHSRKKIKLDDKEKERGRGKEKASSIGKSKGLETVVMERLGSGGGDIGKVADAAAMPSPESLGES